MNEFTGNDTNTKDLVDRNWDSILAQILLLYSLFIFLRHNSSVTYIFLFLTLVEKDPFS